MGVVISIDAGTTGVRAFAVDENMRPIGRCYREFTQHFPRAGWVEHDATEIWATTCAVLTELVTLIGNRAIESSAVDSTAIAAIGVTNQRETVVAWDRRNGRPLARAIVWQDRRTSHRCDELQAAGLSALVRSRTGLVLDPYFSATKIEWLLRHGGVSDAPHVAFGTIDSWILWNLTAGDAPTAARHVTDASNASRTMLYDIGRGRWDDELCAMVGVSPSRLPAVVPSIGVCAHTASGLPVPAGIPIAGVLGDQQAALFGHACHDPGMAKNTYGTGSFVLRNEGHVCPSPVDGLLTTIAWQIDGRCTYAYEGAIFTTGAAVQWLRDGLGIIATSEEIGPLAESCTDADGVFFVPALTGLGSPWWDSRARGTIVGITRGTTRAHLARATIEAMALQTRDVVEAMARASGTALTELRVDGGAAVMDLLLQEEADQLDVPVARAAVGETTALGAAFAAGIGAGVWTTADVRAGWSADRRFFPRAERRDRADHLHARWQRAVERSRDWAE